MKECCDSKKNEEKILAYCPKCATAGGLVKRITLEHLLRKEKLSLLQERQYFFCSIPNCNVVYFSEDGDILYKADLKIRVGIKEREEPIPVCYCFGYTKKMILDDLRQNGHSTIRDKITEKARAGKCRCNITNPQGICCLGNVAKVIEEAIVGK